MASVSDRTIEPLGLGLTIDPLALGLGLTIERVRFDDRSVSVRV